VVTGNVTNRTLVAHEKHGRYGYIQSDILHILYSTSGKDLSQ